MAKFTVMGFTEAELGFILAGTFAAVVGLEISEVNRLQSIPRPTQSEVDSLRKLTDSLRKVTDSLKAANKKSNLTPPCSERGLTESAVDVLTVTSATRFQAGDQHLNLIQVRARLAKWIVTGDSLKCRFSVELRHVDGLESGQYLAARRALNTTFYIRDR